jgi:hypothetical protein
LVRAAALGCLLGLIAGPLGGCARREWVQIRPEPEAYPFESARKICDNWARDEATVEYPGASGWPPRPSREEIDFARYHALYARCMEHYGWVLQTVPREDERAPAPAGDDDAGGADGDDAERPR